MQIQQNKDSASLPSPGDQTSQIASLNQDYFELDEKNQQISRNIDNRFDQNNMTFSEAQQTNYQNLEEFQIQQQQLKHYHICSEQSQKTHEQSLHSENVSKFGSHLAQGNPDDMSSEIPFLSLEQRLMNELQAQFDQNDKLQGNGEMNIQNQDQTSSIISSLHNTQRNSYPIEFIQQSNKAKLVMNKLKNKGQIKIHRGLKKNNYLVNSKQNSQPQRQLGQNNSNQNSGINNNVSTISQLNFNQQRSSLGPQQMSGAAGTPMIKSNDIEGVEGSTAVHFKNKKQILQTKSNNSSLVTRGMVLKAGNLSNNNLIQKFNILSNNIAHIKKKTTNSKMEDNYEKMKEVKKKHEKKVVQSSSPISAANIKSILNFQNPIKQLNEQQEKLNQKAQYIMAKKQKLVLNKSNQEQVSIQQQQNNLSQLQQQVHNYDGTPNNVNAQTSFKKLRKPSQIKHNSLDRNHIETSQQNMIVNKQQPVEQQQQQEFHASIVQSLNQKQSNIQPLQSINPNVIETQSQIGMNSIQKAYKNKQILANHQQHISAKKSKILSNQRSNNHNNHSKNKPDSTNKKGHQQHLKSFDSQSMGRQKANKMTKVLRNNFLVNHNENFKKGKGNNNDSYGTNSDFNQNFQPVQIISSYGSQQSQQNTYRQQNQPIHRSFHNNQQQAQPNGQQAQQQNPTITFNNGNNNINSGIQSLIGPIGPNTTNIHNNNSFFINGPVSIINMTASNSKNSKSKSNKSSGETGQNKMSSNKSGEMNNKSFKDAAPIASIAGDSTNKLQFILQTQTYEQNTTQPNKPNFMHNSQNELIFATQDNCNPNINKQSKKGTNGAGNGAGNSSLNDGHRVGTTSHNSGTLGTILSSGFQLNPPHQKVNESNKTSSGGETAGYKNNQAFKNNTIFNSFDINAQKNSQNSSNGKKLMMTKKQLRQSIIENQNRHIIKSKEQGGGLEGNQLFLDERSAGQSKKGKNDAFKIFHTEDNRSSFTKNAKSKKSGISGGGPNSGGPSGSGSGFPNQNKTSSSKNTNKKNRKQSNNRDSVEMRISKRKNFLDEFDQFEQQYDKQQNTKNSVFENDVQSTRNYLQNKVGQSVDIQSKVLKEHKDAKKKKKDNAQQKQVILTAQGTNNVAGGNFGNRSFMKSQSSDRVILNNMQQQYTSTPQNALLLQNSRDSRENRQSQVNKQYDDLMRDFQAVTQKLLLQQQVVDLQNNCQQCQLQAAHAKDLEQRCLDSPAFVGGDNAFDHQILGTYQGLEYQHIQHNRLPTFGGGGANGHAGNALKHLCPQHQNELQSLLMQDQNQIVSQSKIIIPRGIIDFKKGHSVSIERDNRLGNNHQFDACNEHISQEQSIERGPGDNGQQKEGKIQVTFNEIAHELPPSQVKQEAQETMGGPIQLFAPSSLQLNSQSQVHSRDNSLVNQFCKLNKNAYRSQDSHASSNVQFSQQRTFMLEPRDESLMRKKKVIEILKTFQETDENQTTGKTDPKNKGKKTQKNNNQNNVVGNFGEQFDQMMPKMNKNQAAPAKKKSNSNVPLLQSFNREFQNHTYYVGKPIVIQHQNRVKKNNKFQRRRDQNPADIQNENADAKQNKKSEMIGIMSDLNNFMMIEDLKINEQEEKFMQQTRLNQQKALMKQQLMEISQPENLGAFEENQEIDQNEQRNLAEELGVSLSNFDKSEKMIYQEIFDQGNSSQEIVENQVHTGVDNQLNQIS